MPDWIESYQVLLIGIGIVSVFLFISSVLIIPLIIAYLAERLLHACQQTDQPIGNLAYDRSHPEKHHWICLSTGRGSDVVHPWTRNTDPVARPESD